MAIRYLGGILELPSFWRIRGENDPHSLSDGICSSSIRLLEDLATDSKGEAVILRSQLDTMDPAGIQGMIFAFLCALPKHLKSLSEEHIRSADSRKIAVGLMEKLQKQV